MLVAARLEAAGSEKASHPQPIHNGTKSFPATVKFTARRPDSVGNVTEGEKGRGLALGGSPAVQFGEDVDTGCCRRDDRGEHAAKGSGDVAVEHGERDVTASGPR